jgi:hypothetical protein
VKKVIIVLIAALGLLLFFSYRLTLIPSGITGDEASFGYNGILLARTLRDENGRKLPVFVLSLGGTDWRQPVTQYFTAVIFKIFGPSLFNLRMTAVIFAVVSVIIIFFIGKELLGTFGGIVTATIMATTPVFMIQSHLALDNIAPVPFVAFWLLALYLFQKSKKNYWLILSAVSLGIGYYSYKSMRIFVPIWVILTLIYLAEPFLAKFSKKNFKNILKPVLTFAFSILPFFLIIPYLEFQYSGAVLNHTSLWISNLYNFIYNYLSNFDPSFLFIKGDEILVHSTGVHGMYLLMSAPFFILGLIYSWKKSSFWKLIILSFFLGPLMFGYIGQIHRSSRLLAEIPLYSLISAFGFITLRQKKAKVAVSILVILFLFNYFDFLRYYFGNYAKDTANLFNCYTCQDGAYKILKDNSVHFGLNPIVDHVLVSGQDPTRDFVKTMYFIKSPRVWDGEQKDFPKNAVLMTNNSNVAFLTKIDHFGSYYFYVNKN